MANNVFMTHVKNIFNLTFMEFTIFKFCKEDDGFSAANSLESSSKELYLERHSSVYTYEMSSRNLSSIGIGFSNLYYYISHFLPN